MHEFSIRYDGPGEIPHGTKIEYEWALEVIRVGEREAGVEFSVGIRVAELEGQISYRLSFTLEEGSPEAEDPERALRTFAARSAPVTLFPYIREAFGSAAMRCGLHFALPFQNVGTIFSEDEIKIPEPPGATTDE